MKPFYLFSLTTLSAALLGMSQTAHADDDTTLAPVVVTATRTPVTADDTLASVTVISREQIATSSARDVGDLLRYYAGLDVVRSGSIGQQTSIFVRGANSDQTLVMVDGVRINNGTSGLAAIQNVHLDDIDHIEVVKGPNSTLYGSDAIGGTINIITRKPQDTSTSLNIGAGSEHTLTGDLRQNFHADAFSGSVNVGGTNTRGYPVFADSDVDRGYKNQNAGVNLDYQKDDLTLSGRFQGSTGRDQYLSGGPLDEDFENTLGTLEARYQVAENYLTILRFSSFHEHLDQNQADPYAFPLAYDFAYNTRREVDWQNDYSLPGNNLVSIGGTWKEEKVDELSYGTPYNTALSTSAAYIQDQFQYEAFSAQAGGRMEHSSQFGQHETGSLALGWAFDKANRAYASISTGFHAPTADELFGFAANPQLKPEESVNREIGFHHDDGLFTAQAAVYANDVKDLIQSVAVDPINFIYQDFNVGHARLRGAELGFGLHKGGWNWQNQASYTEAVDADTSTDLLRRPRRQISSSLDYQWERFNVGGEAIAQSRSMDFGQFVLPGFTVLNLHTGVTVSKQLSLRLNVDNIANKRYALLSDDNANFVQEPYVAQPRLVSVSANLKF